MKKIFVLLQIVIIIFTVGCSNSEFSSSNSGIRETLSFSDWKESYRNEIDRVYEKARSESDKPLSKAAFEIGAYTRYKAKR